VREYHRYGTSQQRQGPSLGMERTWRHSLGVGTGPPGWSPALSYRPCLPALEGTNKLHIMVRMGKNDADRITSALSYR